MWSARVWGGAVLGQKRSCGPLRRPETPFLCRNGDGMGWRAAARRRQTRGKGQGNITSLCSSADVWRKGPTSQYGCHMRRRGRSRSDDSCDGIPTRNRTAWRFGGVGRMFGAPPSTRPAQRDDRFGLAAPCVTALLAHRVPGVERNA